MSAKLSFRSKCEPNFGFKVCAAQRVEILREDFGESQTNFRVEFTRHVKAVVDFKIRRRRGKQTFANVVLLRGASEGVFVKRVKLFNDLAQQTNPRRHLNFVAGD